LYIVAAVGVVVVMFWGGLELRRYPRQQTKSQRVWRMLAVLLGAAALVTVAAERYHLRGHPRPPSESQALGNSAKRSTHKKGAGTRSARVPKASFRGAARVSGQSPGRAERGPLGRRPADGVVRARPFQPP